MILTISDGCFSDINQPMENDVRKYTHSTETLPTQMMRDAEAVELAVKWLEANKSYNNDRINKLLMCF